MMAATESAREMALAELLGEVDRDGANDARVARDDGAHSAPLDLDLGNLDITTGAGDADEEAFARLLGVGVVPRNTFNAREIPSKHSKS